MLVHPAEATDHAHPDHATGLVVAVERNLLKVLVEARTWESGVGKEAQ